MKYVRVRWKHTNPDEPVWIFSELDRNLREIRKIECFNNGYCDYATPTASSGTTVLYTKPLPDLDELARRDPEFEPVEITEDEFEKVWTTRRFFKK